MDRGKDRRWGNPSTLEKGHVAEGGLAEASRKDPRQEEPTAQRPEGVRGGGPERLIR